MSLMASQISSVIYLINNKLSYRRDSNYNDAVTTPFKAIHGHWFWYQSKARVRHAIILWIILTYILSHTVFELPLSNV